MNSIEEKLWNYIDGSCSDEEHEAIGRLIETDEAYRRTYEQLLALDMEFSQLDLDEPPMAFTYNVMEAIRAEEARVPLKSAINKNIIRGITGFFVLTISALIIYLMLNVNWSAGNGQSVGFALPQINLSFLKNFSSSPVIKGFLFFDVVFALFLFDGYLRRQRLAKEV